MELGLSCPVLLVMCTGNVCRSPMAEALLIHHVTHLKLSAKIISRGLAAPIGRPPHPFAIQVAEAHGVAIPSTKRSEPVSGADMRMANAVFVMDDGHRREVQRRFPSAAGKTFLLGHWQSREISDPINMPLASFEEAWHGIAEGVRSWIEKLVEARLLRPAKSA